MIILADYQEKKTILTRYLHLKEKSNLKVGEKVKFGQVIGYMGKTGLATGVHLHFEYWICPKNYRYVFSDIHKYAVDPIDYCYFYPNMKSHPDDLPKLRKVVGSPVSRDSSHDQIEVIITNLNCRKTPNGTILGYLKPGIYNILSQQEKDGYTWYEIESEHFIAYQEKWANLYIKQNSCDVLLQEKERQITVLNQKLLLEQTKIEQIRKIIS